jgi:hypothetical protein
MDSKGSRPGGESDHDLIFQTKKGKDKGSNKGKGMGEDSTS